MRKQTLMKYLRSSAIVLVVVLLSSCTALKGIMTGANLLAPASNGIAVDAELTVGDKNEEINTEVGRNTNNMKYQAEEVSNVFTNISPLFLLLLILGWLLPSPNEIWKGLKGMVLFWRTKP